MAFIGTLCLILVTTTLAAHFCKRIGIPGVIGQLLVGVLLGEAVLNLIHPNVLVHEFSEIGVIILMFLAGLESDLSLLKKYFRPGILVAVLGVIFPVALGWGTGIIFHDKWNEAVFLGILLAATSVSISVEVLKELNVLDTKEGSTILGASVVDDILVVLVMSLTMAFLSPQGASTTSLPLPIVFLEQAAYFVLIYLLVRFIAPYLLHLSQRLFTNSAVIIMSLVICLAMSYLADFVGLSSVIGAFFAGIAVSQTKVKHEVQVNTEALGYAIFIPVFFVSIGLEVNFDQFFDQLGYIIAFTLVAVFSKLIGGFLGARVAGFERDSSLMVGAGMISRGEMALIILQLGYGAKLISKAYYSPIVIIILLTTLLSPLILKVFTKRVY